MNQLDDFWHTSFMTDEGMCQKHWIYMENILKHQVHWKKSRKTVVVWWWTSEMLLRK